MEKTNNILDKILYDKHKEVEVLKNKIPVKTLQNMASFHRKCKPLLKDTQRRNPLVIAEFKKKSPSKGLINNSRKIEDTILAYERGGASAISVLTNEKYFGGSKEDLIQARTLSKLPLLRKDFIIDEYQIYESKAIGADIVLIIAAAMSRSEVLAFSDLAKSLGMQVLLEIHCEDELKHINRHVDLVGINNRDLKTFTINIQNSMDLLGYIPHDMLKISESGIHSLETGKMLMSAGFDGFLMGEVLMAGNDPEQFLKSFTEGLSFTVSLENSNDL